MNNQKGAMHFVLLGLLLLAFLGFGYVYFHSQLASGPQPTPTPVQSETVPTIIPSPTSAVVQPSPTAASRSTSTRVVAVPTAAPTSAPAAANSSVVVFENELSIPAGDKSQITTRIIEPFFMYYQDQDGPGSIKSFTVKINTNASKKTYPYLANAIFKNGVTDGFTIAENGGVIDWWVPTCMNACPFSDAFRARYPQIVSQAN